MKRKNGKNPFHPFSALLICLLFCLVTAASGVYAGNTMGNITVGAILGCGAMLLILYTAVTRERKQQNFVLFTIIAVTVIPSYVLSSLPQIFLTAMAIYEGLLATNFFLSIVGVMILKFRKQL